MKKSLNSEICRSPTPRARCLPWRPCRSYWGTAESYGKLQILEKRPFYYVLLICDFAIWCFFSVCLFYSYFAKVVCMVFDGFCLTCRHFCRDFCRDSMGWFKDRAGRALPRNSYWLVPPCSHFLWLWFLVLQLVQPWFPNFGWLRFSISPFCRFTLGKIDAKFMERMSPIESV